jgi:hypothetical protein
MSRVEELRAAILGSDDLRREPVDVDVPWDMGGEKLYIQELTADQRDEYLTKVMPDGENFVWRSDLTALILVKVLVTESGERVFEDSDAAALGSKPASVLRPLFNQAMRLSGMDRAAAEAIKEGFGEAQSEPSDIG